MAPPILSTTKRKLALAFLLLPVFLCLPFRHWAFNHAGGWFVSTGLDAEHRAFHLAQASLIVFLSFAALTWFSGALLLFIDGYRRRVTGALLVPLTLLAFFGALVLLFTVKSYIDFS